MKHTIDLRKKPTEAKASSKEAKNFKLKSREITWHAPSFYYNPQKRYLASIIIALLLGAVAILFLQKDTLSAVFLIMSSLVLILYANKRPELNKIIIGDYGIRVGGNSQPTNRFIKFIRPHRSTDRTQACGACNCGSIPHEGTTSEL